MLDQASSDYSEHVTTLAFEAARERIINAIAAAGMTLFAQIDHAAGARDVGMTMPPTTVLIYGHARAGTPIMLASPLAALDLPLRVLVRQRDDGRTVIAFHPVAPLLRKVGVPDDLAARLEPAQQLLMRAVSS